MHAQFSETFCECFLIKPARSLWRFVLAEILSFAVDLYSGHPSICTFGYASEPGRRITARSSPLREHGQTYFRTLFASKSRADVGFVGFAQNLSFMSGRHARLGDLGIWPSSLTLRNLLSKCRRHFFPYAGTALTSSRDIITIGNECLEVLYHLDLKLICLRIRMRPAYLCDLKSVFAINTNRAMQDGNPSFAGFIGLPAMLFPSLLNAELRKADIGFSADFAGYHVYRVCHVPPHLGRI